jgi:hypothetical protein
VADKPETTLKHANVRKGNTGKWDNAKGLALGMGFWISGGLKTTELIKSPMHVMTSKTMNISIKTKNYTGYDEALLIPCNRQDQK